MPNKNRGGFTHCEDDPQSVLACTDGRGRESRSRAARWFIMLGFFLAPFIAIGLLAGVTYLSRIAEPLSYGPAVSAAASVVAIYIIFRLLKALLLCQ